MSRLDSCGCKVRTRTTEILSLRLRMTIQKVCDGRSKSLRWPFKKFAAIPKAFVHDNASVGCGSIPVEGEAGLGEERRAEGEDGRSSDVGALVRSEERRVGKECR